MKKAIAIFCAVFTCVCLVMLYLHRGMIIAAVKGEPMPEAPEGCPAFSCPFFKKKAKDEEEPEAQPEEASDAQPEEPEAAEAPEA